MKMYLNKYLEFFNISFQPGHVPGPLKLQKCIGPAEGNPSPVVLRRMAYGWL